MWKSFNEAWDPVDQIPEAITRPREIWFCRDFMPRHTCLTLLMVLGLRRTYPTPEITDDSYRNILRIYFSFNNDLKTTFWYGYYSSNHTGHPGDLGKKKLSWNSSTSPGVPLSWNGNLRLPHNRCTFTCDERFENANGHSSHPACSRWSVRATLCVFQSRDIVAAIAGQKIVKALMVC